MKEMLIVGRGGQGVVLASQLLADTFARAGYWVQSFPEFKAERRGAPISAFLRWDENAPIHRRYKLRDLRRPRRDLRLAADGAGTRRRVRPRRAGRAEPRVPLRDTPGRSRSPACRPRRSPARTASSPPRGGRWGTSPCSGHASGCSCPTGCEHLEAAIVSRMGAPRRGRTSPPPARATSAARSSVRVAGRHRGRACGRRRRHGATTSSSRSARPTRSRNHTGSWSDERPVLHEAVQRVRPVRVVLPGGRDHAERRRDGGRLDLYCKGCGICEAVCPVRNAVSMEEVARVSQPVPHGRTVMTANEAAAYAVVLARAQVLGCYPITPQTLIVETAGRPRRRPRRRRLREPRERALDARLRDRRRADRRPHVHRHVVAGPPVRARAAPPGLARARPARDGRTSTARSSRRGASRPTSRTA